MHQNCILLAGKQSISTECNSLELAVAPNIFFFKILTASTLYFKDIRRARSTLIVQTSLERSNHRNATLLVGSWRQQTWVAWVLKMRRHVLLESLVILDPSYLLVILAFSYLLTRLQVSRWKAIMITR